MERRDGEDTISDLKIVGGDNSDTIDPAPTGTGDNESLSEAQVRKDSYDNITQGFDDSKNIISLVTTKESRTKSKMIFFKYAFIF